MHVRYFFLCLSLSGILACGAQPEWFVDYERFPEPEQSFLYELCADTAFAEAGLFFTEREGRGTITARFARHRTTWRESEARFSSADFVSAVVDTDELDTGVFVPLSRTCYVYPGEVWENKTASLAGIVPADSSGAPSSLAPSSLAPSSLAPSSPSAALIPLGSLAPPFTACRIDGLDVSDPDYPLVYEGGILFRYRGPRTAEAGKKITWFIRRLREKQNGGSALFTRPGDTQTPPSGATAQSGARGTASLSGAPQTNAPGVFYREERPRLFCIVSGGDVMLGRGVESIALAEGADAVLGATAPLVKAADLALVNLENAVTARGTAAEKTYVFRSDPRTAAAVKDAGFDAALIANNHAFDYGTEGFLDTLTHLDEAGIAVLGAGRNAREAAAPFVMEGNGFPVKVFGLASFGTERNGWDGLLFAADEHKAGMLHAGKRGAERIKAQLERSAFNIVYFHGGEEYTDYPGEETRALYTELIRAGADLVIGTHPHVEQGFEWVEGKPVFWSLGDYVFDEMDDTPGGDKGIFAALWYAGKTLVHVDVYPVFMDGPRTVVMPPDHLERFLRLTKSLAGQKSN